MALENSEDFCGQLLLAIQECVKNKLPEIRYCNQDLGQLEVYTGGSPSVSWPCLLIDFSDVDLTDLGRYEQQGEFTLRFRLGFNPFSQTSNLQDEDVRKLGLYYYALENKIHAIFHGWIPMHHENKTEPLCQPLSCRKIFTENRQDDTFRVRGLNFTGGFMDDSASPKRKSVAPNLNLIFGFEEEED